MLRYGTHQTPGAGGEASGESLGGWEVEMRAGEAPGGRWPGAPQALAGERMMVAVTVTLLPWQEGWEQTKSWASSSVRLSHCASDTETETGLKPTAPPAHMSSSTTHSFHTLRALLASLPCPKPSKLPRAGTFFGFMSWPCLAGTGSPVPKVLTFSHMYPLGLHSKREMKTRMGWGVVCILAWGVREDWT